MLDHTAHVKCYNLTFYLTKFCGSQLIPRLAPHNAANNVRWIYRTVLGLGSDESWCLLGCSEDYHQYNNTLHCTNDSSQAQPILGA